jgi:hypothetical protein
VRTACAAADRALHDYGTQQALDHTAIIRDLVTSSALPVARLRSWMSAPCVTATWSACWPRAGSCSVLLWANDTDPPGTSWHLAAPR